MRNYRDLSPEEVTEMARLYPTTTNRELSRRFDISVDAIQDKLADPLGWKKDMSAVRIGNRGGKSLSEKEVSWIVRHYAHTRNYDIMARFSIGESTLHRIARKHGLTKSRHFMRKSQLAAVNIAVSICYQHGIYEENAVRARQQAADRKERGQHIGFLPGESNKTRFSHRRFRSIVEKSAETRRATIRAERRRILFGLPQRTKLKLTSGGRQRVSHRYLFRKRNCIVPRGSNEIFYDELTNRSSAMEASAPKYGLRCLPAEGYGPNASDDV